MQLYELNFKANYSCLHEGRIQVKYFKINTEKVKNKIYLKRKIMHVHLFLYNSKASSNGIFNSVPHNPKEENLMLVTTFFLLFPQNSTYLSQTGFTISVTFMLSSANAFSLDQSQIFSFR